MSARAPALPLEFDPLIAEAKQRARRRRLVAAVALTVTGAAVWGLQASGGGGSPGEIPWLPIRPQLGPANPPLAPACTASQLAASLSLQGAAGNLAGGISIRNRGLQPCALVGRPKLSFAGATSKWRVTRLPVQGPFDPLAPPPGSLRALAPGKWVSVGLFWSSWCGRGSNSLGNSGQPPAGIVLRAPGGGTVVLSRDEIGHRPLPAPPCYGSPSRLGATRFTPYVPQGSPGSALPLRARVAASRVSIYPGQPASIIKGKQYTQPGLLARAGASLSYTVVLTNRSRHTFRFGRTCPAYTEQIDAFRPQAYILNCHSVGSIAPHASVRFSMRIHVPRNLPTKHPAVLGWTLAPHTWNAPQTVPVVLEVNR